MLVVLTCTCGGAETLARRILKKCGVGNWLSIPIYQGQKDCLDWCSGRKNLNNIEILEEFIKNNSVYVLMVGYTDEGLIFANVKNGSLKEEIEAEAIISKFAKI